MKPSIKEKKPLTNPDEKWAITQKRGHYTIQFLAAKDRNSVSKYKKSSPAFKDARIVRIIRKKRTWHVLILGLHTTNKKARTSLLSLPKEIRDSGPWVRSMGSLQDAMPKE